MADYIPPIYRTPLGPGMGNVKNIDGSTLSFTQRGQFPITSQAVNTVFMALQSSVMVHETNLQTFCNQLNRAQFIVQGYDNSALACFGIVRLLDNLDLTTLDSYFPNGYGAETYGSGGYGGGFPRTNVYGELCYIYQNPSYSGDKLSTQVVNLLMQAQQTYNSPYLPSVLMCIVPTSITIPSTEDYDWVRYILNTTSPTISSTGVTSGSLGTATTSTTNYRGVNAATSNILTLSL
jgi:hypothetical protein